MLEETFKITKSNHPPSTISLTPKPQNHHPAPHPDTPWTPPGVVTPPPPGATYSNDHSNSEKLLISSLNLPCLRLRLFPVGMLEETLEEVVADQWGHPWASSSLDKLLRYLGTTLSAQPQHGPDQLPGDPNPSQTRADLCYAQQCCSR